MSSGASAATPPAYTGMPLPNQSQGAYTQALGGASMAQNAAMDPATNQLATANLQPYMNPYTQSVTNATIADLDRQEALQGNALAAQDQAQGAFGGDRFAITQAANNRDYDVTRAQTMAGLNSANYTQAQQGAQYDITNRLNAGQIGNAQLGTLSNQGFNYGQQLQQNQMNAGYLMQQQQQQLIDAANAQYRGYTSQPQTGLGILNSSLQAGYNPAVSTGSSQTDPGIAPILGATGSMLAK